MNNTIRDFIGVEEISDSMSKGEYDSFLARMAKKGYSNDATRGEDGNVIDADDQVLAGAKFLEENNVGI